MKDWDDDMEYELDEDELEELLDDMGEAEQEIEKLEKSNLQFEVEFYSRIAGTKEFQVLNIPDEDGYVPTQEDLKILKKQVNMAGMKLLYRVSVGNHAIVFGPESKVLGLVPEDNNHGFMC